MDTCVYFIRQSIGDIFLVRRFVFNSYNEQTEFTAVENFQALTWCWSVKDRAFECYKYIDSLLFMSATLYLISCFFGAVLILINMITSLVVLILRREQDWMLLLLLIDRHSDRILLTCVIRILTHMVAWILLLFLWGRYVLNVFYIAW